MSLLSKRITSHLSKVVGSKLVAMGYVPRVNIVVCLAHRKKRTSLIHLQLKFDWNGALRL